MKLDPREWYFFQLVDAAGNVVDGGYETPRRAIEAAGATGTRAVVRLSSGGWASVELPV